MNTRQLRYFLTLARDNLSKRLVEIKDLEEKVLPSPGRKAVLVPDIEALDALREEAFKFYDTFGHDYLTAIEDLQRTINYLKDAETQSGIIPSIILPVMPPHDMEF